MTDKATETIANMLRRDRAWIVDQIQDVAAEYHGSDIIFNTETILDTVCYGYCECCTAPAYIFLQLVPEESDYFNLCAEVYRQLPIQYEAITITTINHIYEAQA